MLSPFNHYTGSKAALLCGAKGGGERGVRHGRRGGPSDRLRPLAKILLVRRDPNSHGLAGVLTYLTYLT